MDRIIKYSFFVLFTLLIFACKNNSSAHFLKNGSAKYKLGDYKNAIVDLNQAVLLDESLAEAYYVRALSYSELGKFKLALQDFNRAIDLEPEMEDAIFNRAFYARQPLQDFQGAVEDYDLFILRAGDRDISFALNNRGYCKFKLNDVMDGLEDINHSIKLNGQNSFAFRNRALIFIEMDSLLPACSDLQKALELGFSKDYGPEVKTLVDTYCP